MDAAFLYLERKQIPLHIAALMIFDGPIPFDSFVSSIDSKLDMAPRYRQVVVSPPYNLAYPTWQDDPEFDIRRHIFRTRLERPGGKAQLQALASDILTGVMDRGKSLWDIHVVEGLRNGRGALIARVHHALADGISAGAFLKVILDATPDRPRLPAPRRRAPVLRKPAAPGLLELLRNAATGAVKNLIAAEAGAFGLADAFLSGRLQNRLQGFRKLLPEFATVERLPFNRPCTGDRLFRWTEFDFSDVQAIRGAAGGTVNDVLLTALTRGIALYVKSHRETVAKRFVRVVCPVNVRTGNGETPGNQITFFPVSLPLDIPNPVKLLQAVTARTEIMKNTGAAEAVALLGSWIGATPPPIQALFWSGLPQVPLPVSLCNVICTNVPGPPTPLYACGRRMLSIYPQVPTGYDLGVGVAAQSYAGKMSLGFTADSDAAPDVDRLRDYVKKSFDDLCAAVGRKKTRRRAAPKPAGPRKAGRVDPMHSRPIAVGARPGA